MLKTGPVFVSGVVIEVAVCLCNMSRFFRFIAYLLDQGLKHLFGSDCKVPKCLGFPLFDEIRVLDPFQESNSEL
jgi:hypothetical protein